MYTSYFSGKIWWHLIEMYSIVVVGQKYFVNLSKCINLFLAYPNRIKTFSTAIDLDFVF
jgi:hypothetical protein